MRRAGSCPPPCPGEALSLAEQQGTTWVGGMLRALHRDHLQGTGSSFPSCRHWPRTPTTALMVAAVLPCTHTWGLLLTNG